MHVLKSYLKRFMPSIIGEIINFKFKKVHSSLSILNSNEEYKHIK